MCRCDLFQFDIDAQVKRRWEVRFGKTNEDSKEVQTETLELTSTPLPNGMVKVKTGSNTEDSVYNNWYKSVYQTPATSEVSEAQG